MVKVVVERIPSIFLCCDALITAEDIASASRFQNEARRCEHLAWRRVVRGELGRGIHITYNDNGAPEVDVPRRWISVSHSQGVVAVAIADEPVGIDIESSERDTFARVASRYMSSAEAAMWDNPLWAAYVWCAKEAMYKLYGVRGVSLIDDLRVESFDSASLTLCGGLTGAPRARVQISHHDDDMVVAVATFEGGAAL